MQIKIDENLPEEVAECSPLPDMTLWRLGVIGPGGAVLFDLFKARESESAAFEEGDWP